MASRTIAVVGASLAGLYTARALRAQGYDGRIVVIGRERHRPYDRPPLSKGFLTGAVDAARLRLETDEEDLDAEWVLGRAARRLQPGDGPNGRHLLDLSDGSTVIADGVALATGAEPRMLPGIPHGHGVHVLRTLDDADQLRAALAVAERLVVVGGGFIGLEVAASAHSLGVDVTVVEAAEAPLAGPLGARMGAAVAALHTDRQVRLWCGVPVRRLTGKIDVPGGELTGEPAASGVELADGRHLPADVVVLGVGVAPAVEWLADSGLPLGDGVRCAADGRTGVPGVVALGDCAAWYDPTLGRHVRFEHWTAAVQQAPVAAAALLGNPAPPLPPPYLWSEQYDTYIQFAGRAEPGDEVTVEEGAIEDRRFLAIYHRYGKPVAVLGLNQMRSFSRWRRRLATEAAAG